MSPDPTKGVECRRCQPQSILSSTYTVTCPLSCAASIHNWGRTGVGPNVLEALLLVIPCLVRLYRDQYAIIRILLALVWARVLWYFKRYRWLRTELHSEFCCFYEEFIRAHCELHHILDNTTTRRVLEVSKSLFSNFVISDRPSK